MASWIPGESEGELLPGTSPCPGGLRELSLLPPCSGPWLAGQPCRCSLAEWENAPSPATTWYSCRADTKSHNPGHCFFFFLFYGFFSPPSMVLRAPVGKLLSQYNPSLSLDLCNIYCSGLEPREVHTGKKPFLWFFSDISEESLRRS